MTSPESRMLFEQYEIQCGYDQDDMLRRSNGSYVNANVANDWHCWQAAWSARTMPLEAVEEAAKALHWKAQMLDYQGKQQEAQYATKFAFELEALLPLTQLLEQGRD